MLTKALSEIAKRIMMNFFDWHIYSSPNYSDAGVRTCDTKVANGNNGLSSAGQAV